MNQTDISMFHTALTGVTVGISRESVRGQEEATAGVAQRLAAYNVMQQCDQHDCVTIREPGSVCDHDNHARDIHYLKRMLEALGMEAPFPPVGAEERANWRNQFRADDLKVNTKEFEE